MSGDQRTRDYVARQRDAGFSSRDILRKLKRAIAREILKILTTPVAVPGVDDLLPLRQAKSITLIAAANQFGRLAHHDQRTRTRHPTQRSAC